MASVAAYSGSAVASAGVGSSATALLSGIGVLSSVDLLLGTLGVAALGVLSSLAVLVLLRVTGSFPGPLDKFLATSLRGVMRLSIVLDPLEPGICLATAMEYTLKWEGRPYMKYMNLICVAGSDPM